jgi:dipeptidyl aminopeptidase/acylaminoacyl peptidase
MQKQRSYRNSGHRQKLLLSLICVMLAGCSSAKASALTPTNRSSEPKIATTFPVLDTSTPVPTAAQISAPILPDLSKTTGLAVVAMGDGLYTHLFVYGPDSIGMTRLTGGNWDDEDPALSPDGTKIAFSSNKDGQWDIYLLDLKTAALQRITQTKTYDGSPAWSPDGQYFDLPDSRRQKYRLGHSIDLRRKRCTHPVNRR